MRSTWRYARPVTADASTVGETSGAPHDGTDNEMEPAAASDGTAVPAETSHAPPAHAPAPYTVITRPLTASV